MKNLGVFAAPVLAVAIVSGVYYQAPISGDLNITIEGPKEAVIGELVELVPVGAADFYSWSHDPLIDCKPKCNSLFFSARKPGIYVFTLAASSKDGVVQVRHVIVVGGPVPVPDHPIPPKPDDPAPPAPSKTLSDKVAEWTAEVKSPLRKTEAAQLATVYRTIPAAVADGQPLVDAIRNSSDKILGPSMPFWVEWREKVRQEVNALKLKSFAAICAQIADGLERGAK